MRHLHHYYYYWTRRITKPPLEGEIASAGVGNAILLEDGSYLLLEDGTNLLLE